MRHPAPRTADHVTIHAAACRCDICNPDAPSVPDSSATPIIVLGGLAFGFLNAWIIDRLLDGPGIQILFGF